MHNLDPLLFLTLTQLPATEATSIPCEYQLYVVFYGNGAFRTYHRCRYHCHQGWNRDYILRSHRLLDEFSVTEKRVLTVEQGEEKELKVYKISRNSRIG